MNQCETTSIPSSRRYCGQHRKHRAHRRHLCVRLLRPRRANTDSDVDLYVVTKDAARDPAYGALVPARRFSG